MQPSPGDFVSLTDIAASILRHRRQIVKACFVVAVGTAAVVFALGREYASEARFVPDSGTPSVGALSGLAAQFGLSAALGGGAQSPDFYASLAKSRTILGAVADSTFTFTMRRGFLGLGDTVTVTGRIAEFYEIDRPEDLPRERDEAIELLDELIGAGASLQTGVITIRTQTDWPQLSYEITTLVLELISRYNLETLQSRASEERRFVEERLEAQQKDLAMEEDSLRLFLERNRSFATAPQLLIEHDRLQRKVALRQQVVIGLAQAYEQSRIEEVRNTPVLTIVQEPEVPAKGVRRYLVIKVFAATATAFAFMLAIAMIQDGGLPNEERTNPRGLSILWRETLQDLKTPWRRRRRPAPPPV